jgi:uncharacterized protein YjbI with pentapeptide repeats
VLRIPDDPLYQLLREGQVKAFNEQKASGVEIALQDCDFRNCDLKGLDARGLDFSGCYFRNADLRGIDFRETRLVGASFHNAQISGCYFPESLRAEELTMSVVHGTRIRMP